MGFKSRKSQSMLRPPDVEKVRVPKRVGNHTLGLLNEMAVSVLLSLGTQFLRFWVEPGADGFHYLVEISNRGARVAGYTKYNERDMQYDTWFVGYGKPVAVRCKRVTRLSHAREVVEYYATCELGRLESADGIQTT